MQKFIKAYSIFYVHHWQKWFLTERIILCKINTIGEWGIKTLYLDTDVYIYRDRDINSITLRNLLCITFVNQRYMSSKVIQIFLSCLDTWSGFEAGKTAPWPSRGLHHFGKFLEPSDEWAGRGLLLPDAVT